MKTINLGKKSSYDSPAVASGRSVKQNISYPTLRIDNVDMPLGSQHVGKIVTATVRLKVLRAGPEIDEYSNSKEKKYRATFNVLEICFPKPSGVNVKEMTPAQLDAAERKEHYMLKPAKGRR